MKTAASFSSSLLYLLQEENEVEDFHGPVEQRQCRDVIFLLIFIAFLGGVVWLSFTCTRRVLSNRLIVLRDICVKIIDSFI